MLYELGYYVLGKIQYVIDDSYEYNQWHKYSILDSILLWLLLQTHGPFSLGNHMCCSAVQESAFMKHIWKSHTDKDN